MKLSMAFIIFLLGFNLRAFASDMTGGYNHEMHLQKVFKVNSIECSHCHNFNLDPKGKEVKLNQAATASVLKMPLKEICHECHRSEIARYKDAPKTCFTCHKTMENIKRIKPTNHENISWKTTHSIEARVQGESCLNCHMTSQCSKCHLERNDIEMRNHPKNFRFFHSVQARGQPQRCDACHTKTFCVNCHLGKN